MAGFLAMFPGQGSQRVGMGSRLLTEFPETKKVFEEAEDTIKVSVRKLCLEGPEDELQKTANQQPCILTLSVAVWTVLKNEAGFTPDLFAGHSLGEYSALVAAEKLEFSKAVSLVRNRGQFMQEAAPAGTGAMAAVIGFDPETLSGLCKSQSEKSDLCVEVVNFNSPAQQIISGHKSAVEAVCKTLDEQSVRTVMLPVSAPFHSSLMTPARDAMQPLLQNLPFGNTGGKVIANLSGNTEPDYHANLLIDQINHPVLWTKSMETARSEGITHFVEIGPGKVLSGLARRTLPRECQIIHTENITQAISQLS